MSAKHPSKRQMKSAARLYATQALFQMEASDTTFVDVQKEFESHRFGQEVDGDVLAEGDLDLFRDILKTAVDRQVRIDQITDAALVAKWPIKRIDPTLRALFRAAASEMLLEVTPLKVVITEYVDVAKAFFPEGQEPKFVNGVLDHIARDLRPGVLS